MFNKNAILAKMETMRLPNGLFIASVTPDYDAVWLRDTLYCTFCYWYLMDAEHDPSLRGEYGQKLQEGIWAVFDILRKHIFKIRIRIASPRPLLEAALHAKFGHEGEEIVRDNEWSHHQIDALGLFLYIVSDMCYKNVRILRDDSDQQIIQHLIFYLRSVEYWRLPDNGMWEEYALRHASSIGAAVAGLAYGRRLNLAEIPDTLIRVGEEVLRDMLPYESPDTCDKSHHRHDCDAGLLTLIWPYHIVREIEEQDELIARLVKGHAHKTQNEYHKLLQAHGFNRYVGDDYYRSAEDKWRGASAEWPMFFFWLSIIYSQRREYKKAYKWFCKGTKQIRNNEIPEAYQNGKPNNHTPLAWAHAVALIAFCKLPVDMQAMLQTNEQKSSSETG